MPEVDGVKIYADTPDLVSQAQQDDLISRRLEKWSVIPGKNGVVTLPELSVKWWDTEQDVERQVTLPAQELNISGAAPVQADPVQADPVQANNVNGNTESVADGSASVSAPANNEVSALTQADAGSGNGLNAAQNALTVTSTNFVPRWWQWLTFALLGIWVSTLIGWWWTRKATASQNPADADHQVLSESVSWKKLRTLSHRDDAEAYGAAVLEWARARWPDEPVHNLPDVGIRLGDPTLTEDMHQMDKTRFSGRPASDNRNLASLIDIQKQLELAVKNATEAQPATAAHALPDL